MAATLVFVAFIAFGLLFDGIAGFIEGVGEKGTRHLWNSAFNMITCVVNVILSAIIIAMLFIGEICVSLVFAFALLITWVAIITSGLFETVIKLSSNCLTFRGYFLHKSPK